jgi:transposase
MAGDSRRQLSIEKRSEIITLYKTKLPVKKICEISGCKMSTVYFTIDRFKKINSCLDLPRSGRPSKLNNSDKRYLKLSVLRDRRKTLAVCTEDFNLRRQMPVSYSCVNRSLTSWSLIGRVTVENLFCPSAMLKKDWRLPKNT